MTLAGLQNIPDELCEAASWTAPPGGRRSPGASRLPLLRPITAVLIDHPVPLDLQPVDAPFALFSRAPPQSADLISLHIYVNSFGNLNFGLGSAMSVLLLLFLLITTVAYLRIFPRGG